MRESMKRTGLYTVIAFLMATAVCWSLPLVASPLSGRACEMAVVPDTNVNLATHVRDVLNAAGGSVTNDVLTFFQRDKSKLNVRSLYKPVSYPKIGRLTEAEFFSVDFGYHIPSYGTFSQMKNGVNDGWTYLPPTGGAQSPYRCSDFIGYDTEATAPFNMTLENGNPNHGGYCRVSVPTELVWLTNWNTWKGFSGANIQYLNCGFYVPNVGYYPLTDTDQGLSIADLDIGKLNFEITKNLFSVGKSYNAYIVLTTWDGLNGARQWYNPSDTVAGSWWVLATDKPLSFTVEAALSPIKDISVNGSGTASMRVVNGYYAWSDVNISITVSASSGYNWGTGSLLVSVIIPNHYSGTGTSTQKKTILETTFTGIGAGYSQTVNKAAQSFNQLTSKEDIVNATLELRLTIGSTVYTETSYLEITG